MVPYRHVSLGAVILLTTMAVAGCQTKTVAHNAVNTTTPALGSIQASSTIRLSAAPDLPQTTTGVIESVPNQLDAPGWLVSGDQPDKVYQVQLDKTVTIQGVTWRVPDSIGNSQDRIMLVPAVVNGHGVLVWSDVSPIMKSSTLDWYPTHASSLWVTPWRKTGGLITDGAELITNNISPLWSTNGQFLFPSQPMPAQNLASKGWDSLLTNGAWTGWVHLGKQPNTKDFSTIPPKQTDTIAVPMAMWSAMDGIVLEISAHLMGTNQGGSENLYYIDLYSHRVYGIASLTEGGGTFADLVVGPVAVFVQESNNLTSDGTIRGVNAVFNEQSHQHEHVAFWGTTLGRPTVDFRDGDLVSNGNQVRYHLHVTQYSNVMPKDFPS